MRRGSAFPWTLGSTVVLSAGGFLFWLLVARQFDGDVVGAGASLFSVCFFLIYATNLGMPVLITRYAVDRSSRSASITAAAMAVTSLSGALGAVIFVLVASPEVLDPLGGRHLSAVALMVIVAVSVSVSTVVDARLIASLRLREYTGRVLAITILRLLSILVIPVADDGLWLFVASVWAFGATSLVFIPSVVRASSGTPRVASPGVPDPAALVRFSLSNYLGQLALQGPIFLTPLLVLISVDSAEYSDFYLAWGFASVLLMLSQMIGQTLLAEASNNGRSDRRTALAIGVGVALALAAALVTALAGRWLAVTVYGEQYEGVGGALPWLMLGCAPAAVASVAVSEARYAERNRAVLWASVPFALLIALGVAVGAAAGDARGASMGWLIGSVAALGPSLVLLRSLDRGRRHAPIRVEAVPSSTGS